MGTYCELYVADCPILPSKSQVAPIAMTMFRERDKRVFDRRCAERNQIGWGHVEWDPEEEERVVEYSATVSQVRDRLNVMGFSLAQAEADFNQSKQRHLTELREGDSDVWAEEIALLETSSFADFLGSFRLILTSGIHPIHYLDQRPEASPLLKHILLDYYESFYWGFPCSDLRSYFRALVEVVPGDGLLTQDITDLVHGGYYDESDRVCDLSLTELKGNYSADSRIIVLTEGRTDSEVLKAAIELLYPHLYDYYSFMDLTVRAPGGTSSLVDVTKAFAGAGIENRTIAIFDNDAAGHAAVNMLRPISLPKTIRVMNYPDTTFAAHYPTSGPNGAAVQDVNGSAASIELYYGHDVLTDNGVFIPVQWSSFDSKSQRYQGAIQQKDLLKTRFLQKVKSACHDPSSTADESWNEMKQLLSSVFGAFAA